MRRRRTAAERRKMPGELLKILTGSGGAGPWIRLCICAVIWKAGTAFIGKIYGRKEKTLRNSFRKILAETAVSVFMFAAGLFQFESVRALSGYFARGTGIAAVLLGVCFQESLSNPIHGIIIAESCEYRIGDVVRIIHNGKEVCGTITGMGMRSVSVDDVLTGSAVRVPNKAMDTEIVENYSTGEQRPNRYPVTVEVAYGTDIAEALGILDSTVSGLPLFVDTRTEEAKKVGKPASGARIRRLGSSGIELTAVVSTATRDGNFEACSDAYRLLTENFAAAGIEIPYAKSETTVYFGHADAGKTEKR